MTTKAQWTAIREQVFKDQQGRCWGCFNTFNSHEDMHAHHACIPKGHTNYKKKMKLIDSPENIVLLCSKCHADHGKLTNWFQRWSFFSKKVDQGYDMQKWLDDLDLKSDEYFVYIGKNKKYNKEYRSNGLHR